MRHPIASAGCRNPARAPLRIVAMTAGSPSSLTRPLRWQAAISRSSHVAMIKLAAGDELVEPEAGAIQRVRSALRARRRRAQRISRSSAAAP